MGQSYAAPVTDADGAAAADESIHDLTHRADTAHEASSRRRRPPPPSFSSSPLLTLQHPLEGLEQWSDTHPKDFSYAFLDDSGEREIRRLDAAALRRETADVRDALSLLVRERGQRAQGPLCVLLVFPPGLDFLPVLLGAMAVGSGLVGGSVGAR